MGERIFVAVTVATTLLTLAVSGILIADPAFALPAGSAVTPAVETFARACSIRSLAVGGALLVLLARRSTAGLIVLLWVTGLFQAGDALVHALNGVPAAFAATALALVAFGSAGRLTRSRTSQEP
ncbi:hypothetical protein DP939_27280 [Spongiactinospora rosea]|uniref:DoxX-like protein n=1 Tax=Spongiactinospora rosea TaxID=2248750 RepID=A0A366LV33_9ACTN|nr:hypothetical protein [Spongiactinospora rosea]RBQ17174.1 hypothetical protein DP939_27280 [Spongiactinospora rosea]